MKKFLVGVLDNLRGEKARTPTDMKNSLNISNVLAQFLNSQRAVNTIRTNKIHNGRGRPQAGTINIINDVTRLGTIRVHVGVEDKILRFGSTYFCTWLQESGYSVHLMTRALETEFGAQRIQGRIACGTNFAGASEYLIEIDLKNTQHVNFLDEA
jgi:hypothetical protein